MQQPRHKLRPKPKLPERQKQLELHSSKKANELKQKLLLRRLMMRDKLRSWKMNASPRRKQMLKNLRESKKKSSKQK